MWRPNPLLVPVEALQQSIDRTVLRSMELLRAALGELVDLHHVGSTALFPLLTEGIVDILVLGEPDQIGLLRSMVTSIEELHSQVLPVRVEFADRHKPNRSLHIRHCLATSPMAMGEFLALQRRYEHIPGKEYPRAKEEFFETLLSREPATTNGGVPFEQLKQQTHMIEVRTKRLMMQSPLSIHGEEYAAYIRANRTSHERYHRGDPKHLEAETWRKFFADEMLLRHRREALTLLVRRQDTKALIGTCHFSGFIWGRYEQCCIGYNIAQNEEGNGYMTEAVASAVHYIGENWGVHRVQAYYDPRNIKSANLLERVGFHVEGKMSSYMRNGDEWRDCVLAALHW